jgi:protein gp37
MGKTTIEWTDASWNPIVGCTKVSPGCANCYAERLSGTRLKNTPAYSGLTVMEQSGPGWTGEVRFLPERLEEPRHWRKPRKIFVCDMGDLFHESVEDEWIEKILTVIHDCPQHIFQILTKRADRMHAWFKKEWTVAGHFAEPLPNLWVGVSVENQHFADERIPLLLATPAAVRWISAEPLLGPVDLPAACEVSKHPEGWGRRIDWVVCGGESGANARPMHPDWARALRDRCHASGIPFFFKQWGAWKTVSSHADRVEADLHKCQTLIDGGGSPWLMMKCGKKKAGRLLDGREWNEFPGWPTIERRRARHPLKMLADCKRLGIDVDRRKDVAP